MPIKSQLTRLGNAHVHATRTVLNLQPFLRHSWESKGAAGWSYADCLPYFKKAQTHELGPDEYRGGDGPLHVTRGKQTCPLFAAFEEAGVQAG